MKKIFQNIKRSPKTSLAGLGLIVGSILPMVGVPVVIVTGIVAAISGIGLMLSKDSGTTGI